MSGRQGDDGGTTSSNDVQDWISWMQLDDNETVKKNFALEVQQASHLTWSWLDLKKKIPFWVELERRAESIFKKKKKKAAVLFLLNQT